MVAHIPFKFCNRGPVARIIVADREMEALRLVNESQYGLGASKWTVDLDKAERLSRMVRSGIWL
ncbi:MAG: aldehyde dehydrogenase family protein [Candidatus Nitrosopolaris sp.]